MNSELKLAGHAQLTDHQVELVEQAILDSRSKRTRENYASAFRGFVHWCSENGQPSHPTNPATVAAFLASRFENGIAASSLGVDLAAIRAAHVDAGHRDVTAHRGVTQTAAGLRRRTRVNPSRKARTFSIAELRRIVASIEDTTVGRRDRALILTAFASACRRSELEALSRGDVEFAGSDGVRITIQRSKGDQTGANGGQVVGFPPGANRETDPVRALRVWLALSGRGAVFKRVTRSGKVISNSRLSASSMNRILQARAAEAGVDTDGVSFHSTRVSHVSIGAQNDVDLLTLQAQTRHKDLRTLSLYVRHARAIQDSSAGGLGL